MVQFFFVAVILILAATAVFLWFFLIDRAAGGETYETSQEARKVQLQELLRRKRASGLYIDLGCCYGKHACAIQKSVPWMHVVGIDNSGIRVAIARLRTFFMMPPRPNFVRADIFSYPLIDASVVNVYLPRSMLTKVSQRILRECKPGTIVLTYRVHMIGMVPVFDMPLAGHIRDPNEKVIAYTVPGATVGTQN